MPSFKLCRSHLLLLTAGSTYLSQNSLMYLICAPPRHVSDGQRRSSRGGRRTLVICVCLVENNSVLKAKIENPGEGTFRARKTTTVISRFNWFFMFVFYTSTKHWFSRYKSNEDYVYVRGRGRGKYICEECGIRCKKPSMLKKHIRTHTDVRPYVCKFCNFAFKTKGESLKLSFLLWSKRQWFCLVRWSEAFCGQGANE